MQQLVRVAKVYPDGFADVYVQRESACSGDCHKCSGCGAAKQQVYAHAKNLIGAVPGDKVIVNSDDRQVISAMFVVYILPLILLLSGYFVGLAFQCLPGLFAFVGFCLGILLIILYNRYVKMKRPVRFVIVAFAED